MQRNTFLYDAVEPNEQAWIYNNIPLFYTSIAGQFRTFSFNIQVASAHSNHALWYLTLDGGKTWSQPNLAGANVVNGTADFYFDSTSTIANMALLLSSFGNQAIILQDFNLETELYSANYGNVANVPTHNNWFGTPKIARMQDGTLLIAYMTGTGIQATVFFAGFKAGVWTVLETQISTNIPLPNLAYLEAVIPDPSHNLCHVFYSDHNPSTLHVYYRQIKTDGTMSAITGPFNLAWNITVPNLNQGRAFGTGVINFDRRNTPSSYIAIPVAIQSGSPLKFSIAVITGSPTSAPVFSISSNLDTALNTNLGSEPEGGVLLLTGAPQPNDLMLVYFSGDGTNFYNQVRQINSQFGGSGWSPPNVIYDATGDPNAGKNSGTGQWLNFLSASLDPNGVVQFQPATWLTVNGEPFQNVSTLTTAIPVASPTPINIAPPNPAGIPGGSTGSWFVNWIPLPDPKLCKSIKDLKPEWQGDRFSGDFSFPDIPWWKPVKFPWQT